MKFRNTYPIRLLQVLLPLYLISFSIVANAQSAEHYIDKLNTVTKAVDSADCYATAAIRLMTEPDPGMAIPYARKAIALSKKSDNYTIKAKALFSMANVYLYMTKLDSSKYYAEKTIEAYDKSGKKGIYYTYALNAIGAYYLNKGAFDKAIDNGHRQLEVAIETKDTLSMSNSYTMLTAVYNMVDNNDESIKYCLKALELNKLTGNTNNRATVLSNLGLLYLSTDRPEVALPYIHEAIFFSEEVYESKQHQATAYMFAGECHNKLKNYDSALYYLGKAEQNIQSFPSKEDKANLYILYANTYSSLNNNNEAYEYAQKALMLAEEYRMGVVYSNSLELLSSLAAQLGDYESAYKYLQEFKSIDDSLTGAEVQNTITDIREKYESDKKDERIAEEQRRNKLLIGGISIALALVALILFQYIRQKQATQTIRKQSDKLTLLMKELHHRVKNNLQIISSLLSLQSFRIKDQAASKAVRDGQQRIEAMSLIHQRLYTRDNITEINIREFINDLVDSLQNAYGYNKESINIRMQIDDELMNVDQAIPLSLIINELVTNAFKYAYEDNDNPELVVTLKKEDNNLILVVADNGKGVNISEWNDKEGSFGKELIQTFVQQLNGYLDVMVNKGSKFTLTIPYTA